MSRAQLPISLGANGRELTGGVVSRELPISLGELTDVSRRGRRQGRGRGRGQTLTSVGAALTDVLVVGPDRGSL